MEQQLELNIREDIKLNKEQIKEIVEQEIITAYEFQRGRVNHFANRDKGVATAATYLENSIELK